MLYTLYMKNTIAWFVSPHGFGHAARASAVMEALLKIKPETRFEIFTIVPEFFFQESLSTQNFGYHELLTDIGLVQESALISDIPATVRRLNDFLPFEGSRIRNPANHLKELGCQLVVCDIAPMGIAVAKAAGIPSLLIENFTWSWIYEHYSREEPAINRHILYLEEIFSAADYHLQTEPVCKRHVARGPYENGTAVIPPISRSPRQSRSVTREKLDIPAGSPVIMISMGGVPEEMPFIDKLGEFPDINFVIPGSPVYSHKGNILRLPHDSGLYHPDLIHTCDAVIGKPGYSTLAEVYQAGIPFGSVARPNFRESAVMEEFIRQNMHGIQIGEKEFRRGDWLNRLPDLLNPPRYAQNAVPENGADSAARFILDLF